MNFFQKMFSLSRNSNIIEVARSLYEESSNSLKILSMPNKTLDSVSLTYKIPVSVDVQINYYSDMKLFNYKIDNYSAITLYRTWDFINENDNFNHYEIIPFYFNDHQEILKSDLLEKYWLTFRDNYIACITPMLMNPSGNYCVVKIDIEGPLMSLFKIEDKVVILLVFKGFFFREGVIIDVDLNYGTAENLTKINVGRYGLLDGKIEKLDSLE